MNVQQALEAREATIDNVVAANVAAREFARATFSNKDLNELLARQSFLSSAAGRVIHGTSALWKSIIIGAQVDFLARTQM